MALAPRRRPVDVRGLAWLVVPAGLAAAFGPSTGGLPVVVVALAALLTVGAAAAMLPTDPRLAIAGALPVTCLGLAVAGHPGTSTVGVAVLIATAPAVLAVAVTRTRRLRRPTPI